MVGGFQKRLRQLRRDMLQNQTEFATRAGISKATQVSYELGQTLPNVEYIGALPDSVDLNRLIRGTPAASIDWDTLAAIAKAIAETYAGPQPMPVEKLLSAVRQVYEATFLVQPDPNPTSSATSE